MKKSISFLFLPFIFIFSSIFQSSLPKKEQLVNIIIAETAKTLADRHQISPVGNGSSMMHEIESLSIMFRVYRKLTRNEARIIAVNCVEEFLNNINTNEEIRPYLKNYPFTPENVSILLFISDEKGNDIYHPELGIVDASHEKIIYKTDEEDKPGYREVIKESYQEALALVRNQSL